VEKANSHSDSLKSKARVVLGVEQVETNLDQDDESEITVESGKVRPRPLPPLETAANGKSDPRTERFKSSTRRNPFLSTYAKNKLIEIAEKKYDPGDLRELGDDILSILEDIEFSICIDGQVYIQLDEASSQRQDRSLLQRNSSRLKHPFELMSRMEEVRKLLAQTSILMLSQPRQKLKSAVDLFDRNLYELMEDFLKLNQLYDYFFEDVLTLMKPIIMDDFEGLVQDKKNLETYIRFVLRNLENEPDSVDLESLKFFLINYPKVQLDRDDEDSRVIYSCLIDSLKRARLSPEGKRELIVNLFELEFRTKDFRKQIVKNILKYCHKILDCERQLSIYGQKSLYTCALGYTSMIFNAIKSWENFEGDLAISGVSLQVVPRVRDGWFEASRDAFAGKVYFSSSGRLLYFSKHKPYGCFMTTDRTAQFLVSCGYEFISRKSGFRAAMCHTNDIPVSSEVRAKLMNVLS